MRELHGVGYATHNLALKRHLLFFDKLHIAGGERLFEGTLSLKRHPLMANVMADIRFLHALGVVQPVVLSARRAEDEFEGICDDMSNGRLPWLKLRAVEDLALRHIAAKLDTGSSDNVPLCRRPLPDVLLGFTGQQPPAIETTLTIGLRALPLPDELSSIEDVLAFKNALRDKKWSFRRLLRQLATKQLTQAEIRDEVEYLAHEYRKAMEIHRVKASQSFLDVFIISPLEIVENLVKLNWSKIAKGALSVRKRKIELLEADMKAPGRECAYVFEARERFTRTHTL